jgi:signal transduction histidine kinase
MKLEAFLKKSMVAILFAFGMLFYSHRTGVYERSYMITAVTVFFVIFPFIFFAAGGYRSGMPIFFVFAVTFSIFMLEGKKALVVVALELLLYAGLCVFAFRYPLTVSPLGSEQNILLDVIVSFWISGAAIGLVMYGHFKRHEAQKAQLKQAREDALQNSGAKSAFLANVNHEIRTRINIMLGMNEMVFGRAVRSRSLSTRLGYKTLAPRS